MSSRLRTARIDAGLSRKALADRIGVAQRTVNYYENARYGAARKSYIVEKWAEVTGRDFEELWGPHGQPLDRTGWLHPFAGCEGA